MEMKKKIMEILLSMAAVSLLCIGCKEKGADDKIVNSTELAIETESEVVEESETVEESEIIEESETAEVVEASEIGGNAEVNDEQEQKQYSFTDKTITMYSQCSLNVRDLPDKDGNKIGTLSTNKEVSVTGQCNETGWYRISYNGADGFVSDSYLKEEKVEVVSLPKVKDNSSAENTQVESANANVDWVSNLNVANNTSQLVVVSASGNSATVSLHNKNDDGSWYQVFSTNGKIGRNGLGKTREGDKKTPVGMYSFTKAFGNAPDPGCTIGYTQMDSSYYWVDDNNSAYYNQLVSVNNVGCDWNSAEHISDIGVYKYTLAVNYNAGCTPGLGSAIFFHCSSGKATAGCIAIPESNMIQLMQNLRGDCIIIIDSTNNVYNY